MPNDPYRPSPSSRSSSGSSGSRSSGSSRSGGDGFRSQPPRQGAPQSQPPRAPGPRKSPLLPALAVAGLAVCGLLLLRGQSSHQPTPQGQPQNQPQSTEIAEASAGGAGGSGAGAGNAAVADGKLQILVAGDVSRSVDAKLRQSAMDGLKFALRQAAPGGTLMHFVFYDRDARTRPGVVEFYEPRDLDEVSSDFVKYAFRPEKGTRQALALSRLEREADALPAGTPTAFVLLTDGEDQDVPATIQEAKKIAARPGFRGLLVIGAQMESSSRVYLRDKLDASLGALGQRKVVCGAEVSDRDADQFRDLLVS